MPNVLAWALSVLLSVAPPGSHDPPDRGAPEDGRRFDPPPLDYGYDLRESWDGIWRRFQDRHGRPDALGPLLQPGPELQSPEYELPLAVASHPMVLERDWARRTRGGRVFIHSDDEFSFFNGVNVKERIPMGRVGALGLRYDRLELREIKSSLFQLVFAFPDIRGSGAFVEIRPIARFEKPDLDLELAFGWMRPNLASVRTRVFFFDPFNNASDALAKNRDKPLELRTIQARPSVGAALELELFMSRHVRAELYAGVVLPSRTKFLYTDPMTFDFRRTQQALLAGGWIELAIPRAPVWIGASATTVRTSQIDEDALVRVVADTPEHETRAKLYVLAHIDDTTVRNFFGRLDVELVGMHRLTRLPAHTSEYGSVTRDFSWLGMLRTQWMPTRVFGFEVGYLVLGREAHGEGELPGFLTGINHRMSTRFALAFDPHVRITFGVGWDLDDRNNRYDQGGMTMIARW
jgi:hypothetical protein